MQQTSKRGVKRRAQRKRAIAMAPPRLEQTHPLGNRLMRRAQIAMARKDNRPKNPPAKGAFGHQLINKPKHA